MFGAFFLQQWLYFLYQKVLISDVVRCPFNHFSERAELLCPHKVQEHLSVERPGQEIGLLGNGTSRYLSYGNQVDKLGQLSLLHYFPKPMHISVSVVPDRFLH